MTDAARDLVVAILRQCVRVAPSPWQAADFARGTRASGSSGVPDEQMEACLALLRAEGVIKPAVGRNGEVLLTPDGARIAKDPNDLDYFCAEINFALPGEGPSGNPLQRKVIAATLRQPPVPRLSRLMLWANLLVFAWGVWLAAQRNVVFEFLLYVPGQRVNLQDIFDRSGMLQRDDFVSGRWWRLLTCCYVHFGLLHLVLNMLALRAVGRDVEWTWGGWRFLVIYLLSGLGGSCAALLALPVGAIAGASGAICGLVAAVAVWLVLNRRYLPRRMVRRASIHLALTGLLITVISLLPGVSGAGHLGGAVAGAVAAVLLHLHRFGSRPVRVLALASLLVLAPAGVFLLKERSDRDPGWKPAIEKADQETFADLKQRLEKLEKSQHALNESHLEELLGIHPNRRDPQLLREALDELPDLIEQFRDAADHLDRMGPLRSEQAEKQRLAALDYFQKRADLLELIQRHLKDKMNWQNQEARAKEVIRAQGRWRRSREQ